MQVFETPSPNFDERDRAIDLIILHYTGMKSCDAAITRLRDPDAKVSAHYVVDEDGRVFRLVSEEKRAWHAGVSSWQGDTAINARSIGIEIVNPGHEFGYRVFPDAQINAVILLMKDINERHAISPKHVLAHSDVAPARKEDPGEKFPWATLAAQGLAVDCFTGKVDPSITYEAGLEALSAIGYDAPTGAHAAALLAFQRRFCPGDLGQGFSPLTKSALLFVRDQFEKK